MKRCLSIGAFTARETRAKLDDHCEVIAYEPKRSYAEEVKSIDSDLFYHLPFAVGTEDGVATFREMGDTSSNLASTILSGESEKFRTKDSYEVEVEDIKKILEKWKPINEIYFDCEGSEISLIMETPVELFLQAEYIEIEFHTFLEHLNQTKEQVSACLEKFDFHYRVEVKNDYWGIYSLYRKEDNAD